MVTVCVDDEPSGTVVETFAAVSLDRQRCFHADDGVGHVRAPGRSHAYGSNRSGGMILICDPLTLSMRSGRTRPCTRKPTLTC